MNGWTLLPDRSSPLRLNSTDHSMSVDNCSTTNKDSECKVDIWVLFDSYKHK